MSAMEQNWGSEARRRLQPVFDPATSMRVAIDTDTGPQMANGDPGSDLIAVCADVLRWFQNSPPPRGYEEAAAELGAALGVFRNAAFGFRSLAGASPNRYATRAQGCKAMLDQGEQHTHALAKRGARLPE
jgi:hypothetical protein